MARKAEAVEASAKEPVPELVSIEDLFDRHQVPEWQRAGLRVAKGWAAGKLVTEEEFLAALRAWLHGPVG